jgi:hypothetical protein
MAYVGFADSNNKAFVLAFDNLRLNEAVVGIVNALEVYPESPGSPAFDVSRVELESVGAGKVLRIQMPNGASLAFRLPKEISSKLRMEEE